MEEQEALQLLTVIAVRESKSEVFKALARQEILCKVCRQGAQRSDNGRCCFVVIMKAKSLLEHNSRNSGQDLI